MTGCGIWGYVLKCLNISTAKTGRTEGRRVRKLGGRVLRPGSDRELAANDERCVRGVPGASAVDGGHEARGLQAPVGK